MLQIGAENLAKILPFRKKHFWVFKISNWPQIRCLHQILPRKYIQSTNYNQAEKHEKKIFLVDKGLMSIFLLKFFFKYLNLLKWANLCIKKLTQEWFFRFQNNQKLGRGIKLKFRISIFFFEYPRPLDKGFIIW